MNGEKTDSSIEKSQEILATLLASLPAMAYRCRNDPDWTMEFVSDGSYELTGYRPDDLILNKKVSYAQLVHPLDQEMVRNWVESALKEEKTFDVVYRIHTSSGAEKWVREIGRGVVGSDREITALEGFITDVSDRKASEMQIQRQIQRFEALRKIDIAITSSLDPRVTFDILLDQVTHQLGVDAADVLLFNPSTRLLEFAAGRGFRTPALQHTRLRLGEGYAGSAALERRIIRVSSLPDSLGDLGRASRILEEDFQSYICAPLIAKGQVKGILEIFNRSRLEPDDEWMGFLETLAGQAAIAIDNVSMFNELQRSNMELALAYDATLEGWSRALELRESETEKHTQRVADLTLRLAQVMRVTSTEPFHIRRGALLHDIGKMGIPDSILLKPGPLTEEEWIIMRKHPVYAYQLLAPIANLRPALDIPYCHHEKWDGSGYPRGLKGEQIPLPARIFAIIDVWDALISPRPYRGPWPRAKAKAYILDQSGKHFDPDVVASFLKLLQESPHFSEGFER